MVLSYTLIGKGFKMTVMGFKVEAGSGEKREKNVVPSVDFQHVLCEGATGSGKTASLILPTLEDRINRGHAIIFFDHKGHEHQKVKYLAKKAGRIDDVVEIGKPYGSYINLMAELDTIRLKEMINENGSSKDSYWANSAANLLEDIVSLLRRVYMIVLALKPFSGFDKKLLEMLEELKDYGIDMYEEPSFQTLAKIIATPKKLSCFKEIVSVLPDALEMMLREDDEHTQSIEVQLGLIYAKILTLKKSIEASDRFTLSTEKSDTNSGNNAVLQHLDNTIASYAKKDYVNRNEYSIASLMQKNAIIIVDTQSFGDDVMKIFLESMLKKAVMRLRTGSTTPLSVFIDEANRVLSPSIDLHSDVLREASVELVLAIQNEEQMISKFSETVWKSIKLNIKHQYTIDIEHRISYNDGDYMFARPMYLKDKVLIDADQSYYASKSNQCNIQKHFLGESNFLPDDFTVVYDLDLFERESAVFLEDGSGAKYLYAYHGEEIVSQVRSLYPMVSNPLSIEVDYGNDMDYDEATRMEEMGFPYDDPWDREADDDDYDNYDDDLDYEDDDSLYF